MTTGFTILTALPSMTSLILIISSLALFIAYYVRKKYSYWECRGAPFARPDSWFFGNVKDTILRRVPNAFVFQRIYRQLDGHKFGGFYQMTEPVILLRDPELIRTILVKSFSHFHDRARPATYEKLDPLSKSLVDLNGERWKNVRYKLTPTFSSGKLRAMEDLMEGCIEELAEYLEKATSGDAEHADVQNVRELMAKVTTDVIGSCAFGLNCNSIRDDDSDFRRIGRLTFAPSYRGIIRVFLRMLSPRLVTLLQLKSLPPEVENFFISALNDAVKHRESNAQKRNDFLQLLINIQAEEKKQLQSNGHQQNGKQDGQIENSPGTPKDILFTDSVVASNAFAFFAAGFETTASTLSYCMYELALNPDICEKLRDEVRRVRQAHDGNLDYNAGKELVYMDSVISETLRKYPPAGALSRKCTESFQMPDSSIVIEKGTSVIVPIYALHHDPKYFPDPERFLPERFSEENKDSIVPGSYLPFGDGPRICIGVRFAKFEMKSVLSYLVSNYTVLPCEKTVIPLKFDPRSGLLAPLGGIWVRLQKI